MNGAALGVLVAVLGVAGLLVVVTHRRALHDMAREHGRLADRADALDRREQRIEAEAHALHEWEGRLRQVAECGCGVPDRPAGPRWTRGGSAGAA